MINERPIKGATMILEVPEQAEKLEGIVIPNGEEIWTFGMPMDGKGYFKTVMERVGKRGLRPTTRQTIYFADRLLENQEQLNFRDAIANFRQNVFWTSTMQTSFPNGMFVYDNPQGDMPTSSKNLAEDFIQAGSNVRYVKPGFRTGEMKILDWLNHSLFQAYITHNGNIDEEDIRTAERLAKKCHKDKAYVFGVDKSDKDDVRYSALYSGRDNGRLYLDCGYGDGYDGYASPVRLTSTEGAKSAPKKCVVSAINVTSLF